MMKKSIFVGWDFDNIWDIKERETYPCLCNMTYQPGAPIEPEIPEEPQPVTQNKPTKLSVEETGEGLTLSWNPVATATSYEVYIDETAHYTTDTFYLVSTLQEPINLALKVRRLKDGEAGPRSNRL